MARSQNASDSGEMKKDRNMETNTTKTPPPKKVTPLPKKKAEKVERPSTKGRAPFVKKLYDDGKTPEQITTAWAKKSGESDCQAVMNAIKKIIKSHENKQERTAKSAAKAAAKAAKAPPAKKAPKAKAVKAPKAPPAPKAAPALPSTPPVPQTVPGEPQE